MIYDVAVFKTQFPIVKFFIYHLVYSRVVRDSYEKSQLQDEFWTLTIDAHLLRATTNWCMVFGNDKEPTHWMRLVKHSEYHVQTFREGLLQKTGLDENGWTAYWHDMVSFRNKFAAHRELDLYQEPVPNFDIALAVAHYYDDWVRNIITMVRSPEIYRLADVRGASRASGLDSIAFLRAALSRRNSLLRACEPQTCNEGLRLFDSSSRYGHIRRASLS